MFLSLGESQSARRVLLLAPANEDRESDYWDNDKALTEKWGPLIEEVMGKKKGIVEVMAVRVHVGSDRYLNVSMPLVTGSDERVSIL